MMITYGFYYFMSSDTIRDREMITRMLSEITNRNECAMILFIRFWGWVVGLNESQRV